MFTLYLIDNLTSFLNTIYFKQNSILKIWKIQFMFTLKSVNNFNFVKHSSKPIV